jgi:hypothetical protein
VNEDTKLVELCLEARYAAKGDFQLSLAECFRGVDVRALKGKDEAGWEAFVKGKGGPDGLVSGWLEENNLWRFLRGYESPTQKKKQRPELTPLDLSSLASVEDLKPPPIPAGEPSFTSEEHWLENLCKEIMEHFGAEDEPSKRVPPMALVRCSRGGKTRALREIANALKVPVLLVSFNDYSCVLDEERITPVGALCRRIAFAGIKGRDFAEAKDQYEQFQSVDVTEGQILEWLGTKPCVLLIDELNNMPPSSQLASFLKTNFVNKRNRYLIFSSHVVSTTTELAAFMETASSRQVLVRHLPLIPSLEVAKKNFSWPALNAREALFYGLVPALIYEAHLDSLPLGMGIHLPSEKRDEAIGKCLDDGLVTEDRLRLLLGSFTSGQANSVMTPLLQLMNTVEEKRVQWIPYHMMSVLESFSAHIHRQIIGKVPLLFSSFVEAKEKSGDAWECLFVFVLIIRLYSRQLHTPILPLHLGDDYSLSYNEPFSGKFDTPDVEAFVNGIGSPLSYPHVAIYFPSHSSFHLYDVIVVHFISVSVKKIYGYQLKEGNALPKKAALDVFEKSVVIRGQAAAVSGAGNQWIRPSKDEITAFFGESGRHWTPDEWARISKQ